MTEIAHASGFASVRRFNSAVQARFGRAPTSLRKEHGSRPDDGTFTLRLDYRPPFDWDHLVAFLGARAMHGIERIEGSTYVRAVPLGKRVYEIRVDNDVAKSRIVATVPVALAPKAMEISARLRHLFDLDARPDVIEGFLGADAMLGPAVKKQRGTRVPGAFDPFEVAIRSVLGQQVTVRGATTLAQRFVEKFGNPVTNGSRSPIAYIFPSPEKIANARTSDVRAIGMPEARAKTLVSVARAIEDGDLVLSQSEDPARAVSTMMGIAGIGNFTSQVVAMRALRHTDAFPSSDLGVRKALGTTKARELEARSEAWRPWRAYAVVHLWRNHV